MNCAKIIRTKSGNLPWMVRRNGVLVQIWFPTNFEMPLSVWWDSECMWDFAK
jgi:hypothetical protein